MALTNFTQGAVNYANQVQPPKYDVLGDFTTGFENVRKARNAQDEATAMAEELTAKSASDMLGAVRGASFLGVGGGGEDAAVSGAGTASAQSTEPTTYQSLMGMRPGGVYTWQELMEQGSSGAGAESSASATKPPAGGYSNAAQQAAYEKNARDTLYWQNAFNQSQANLQKAKQRGNRATNPFAALARNTKTTTPMQVYAQAYQVDENGKPIFEADGITLTAEGQAYAAKVARQKYENDLKSANAAQAFTEKWKNKRL